jgi:hypothetical protein
VFDDHGARHLTTGVSHQVFEQRKFFGGELDPAAGAFGAVFHAIEVEVFDHEDWLWRQVTAPQQRPDASWEFAEREWLWKIVIGAGVETLDPVFDAAALGQDQHRQAWPFQPEMPQDGYPIQLGQVQIEDDQVIVELAAHRPCLFAIFDHIHRVVFPNQALAYKSGQSRIIFRNQNAHKWLLITAWF